MRVLLKLVLDCEPDAAWRALHSPAVMREIASPWFTLESIEPGGFPTRWSAGVHRMRARALGVLPASEEFVDLSEPEGLPPEVRMLRDSGGPLSGPLAALGRWEHSMAVSPDPAGTERTLYRDQLRFGSSAPGSWALWYPVWAMWQWRGRRLKALAPTWAYEPVATDESAV
jgi:hypothetical protein